MPTPAFRMDRLTSLSGLKAGLPDQHPVAQASARASCRARCGHQWPHGRLQERAGHGAQTGLQGAPGRQDLSRARARPARSLVGTIDAPSGANLPSSVRRHGLGKPSVTHYELIEAFRFASLPEVKPETRRTQMRPHGRDQASVQGDPAHGSRPNLARRLGLERSGCTPGLWLRAPRPGEWVTFESSYPADLTRRWSYRRPPTEPRGIPRRPIRHSAARRRLLSGSDLGWLAMSAIPASGELCTCTSTPSTHARRAARIGDSCCCAAEMENARDQDDWITYLSGAYDSGRSP